MHDVSITQFPGAGLAVMRHVGAYNDIGAVFDRLTAWAGARGLVTPDARFFGIYHDDPSSIAEAKLRADAGLTVPPGTAMAGDVTPYALPATRAARMVFKGPYAELDAPYRWLYGTWLPASGEEPADHPCFEEYLNDPKSLPPSEWLTAVYLPLRG